MSDTKAFQYADDFVIADEQNDEAWLLADTTVEVAQ